MMSVIYESRIDKGKYYIIDILLLSLLRNSKDWGERKQNLASIIITFSVSFSNER